MREAARTRNKTQQELKEVEDQVVSLEGELNDLVYELYEVTSEERKVIEDFLDRYSSESGEEALPGAAEEKDE